MEASSFPVPMKKEDEESGTGVLTAADWFFIQFKNSGAGGEKTGQTSKKQVFRGFYLGGSKHLQDGCPGGIWWTCKAGRRRAVKCSEIFGPASGLNFFGLQRTERSRKAHKEALCALRSFVNLVLQTEVETRPKAALHFKRLSMDVSYCF